MASGRPKGGLGSRGHDKPMGVADGSFPIDPFQKGTNMPQERHERCGVECSRVAWEDYGKQLVRHRARVMVELNS